MKILIATEGSKFSDDAIEKCCGLIDRYPEKADVRLIAAAKPVIVPAEPFALSAEYIHEIDEEAHQHAEKVVSRAEQEIRRRVPDIGSNLTTAVMSGAPAQVIVDEAEKWGADLIVVGSHGYGFWQRALLGSVSNAVVHHAPCSVMVVRGNGATNGKDN